MLCSSIDVENIEGDLALVIVKYGGFQEGQESSNDGDEDEFNDEDLDKYTFELGITIAEEPIETLYKYKDVSIGELTVIQNLKAGRIKPIEGIAYKYINSSDDEEAKRFEITSDLGKELVNFITKGQETFLFPGQIWRATYTSKKTPSANILNSVGKIRNAIGAPAVSNSRNWLFIGCNVIEDTKIYTITLEWQLSGEGGWDELIYS
jgi:hypothetical protein